jgi:hypothetical protein
VVILSTLTFELERTIKLSKHFRESLNKVPVTANSSTISPSTIVTHSKSSKK